MLCKKPFDWMIPLRFCARNFVPKIARSTLVLGYKPSGGDGGSYSWAAVADINLKTIQTWTRIRGTFLSQVWLTEELEILRSCLVNRVLLQLFL